MRRTSVAVVCLVILFYGVGDFLTTVMIFNSGSVIETNPFARWAYREAGLLGVGLRKLTVISGALLLFPVAEYLASSNGLLELADRYSLFSLWPEYLPKMPIVVCSVLAVQGIYATAHNILLFI